MAEKNNVLMEDARIIFRNFAGKEGMYNREGDRNFCVLLDSELATELAKDEWNVKTLRAREEGAEPQPYLMVAVSFKGRPPKIVMITSKGRTDIPEEMIEMLDWVDVAQVDLIVRPYDWNVSGRGGRKAYLKTIFITIQEDALELKYNDVPEIGSGPQQAIEAGPYRDYIDAEVVDEMLVIETAVQTRGGRITE